MAAAAIAEARENLSIGRDEGPLSFSNGIVLFGRVLKNFSPERAVLRQLTNPICG